MKQLTIKELKNIHGGISVWLGVGIGALAVFISGIIDGLVHPKTCEGETR